MPRPRPRGPTSWHSNSPSRPPSAALEGRIEEARQTFARAHEGTTNLQVLYLAYEFYRRTGDLEAAEDMLERWLAISGREAETAKRPPPTATSGSSTRPAASSTGPRRCTRSRSRSRRSSAARRAWPAHYGNLGLIYQTRGELDRAEEMHKKSLAIEEKLGRQEGMASAVRQPRAHLPDARRARPGRGDAQEGAGDRREARPPGGHGQPVRQPRAHLPDARRPRPGRGDAQEGARDRREARPPGGHGQPVRQPRASSTRRAASSTGPRRCTRRRSRSTRSSAARRAWPTSTATSGTSTGHARRARPGRGDAQEVARDRGEARPPGGHGQPLQQPREHLLEPRRARPGRADAQEVARD